MIALGLLPRCCTSELIGVSDVAHKSTRNYPQAGTTQRPSETLRKGSVEDCGAVRGATQNASANRHSAQLPC
jgi:hypothetical protein